MTFTDNGDGTATLAGTPSGAGVFPLTLKASNGASTDATQSFTLTVAAPPSITSADTTTFTSDLPGQRFTVTTAPGFPVARTLSATGILPAGMTFTDNGDGTATIAGTPSVPASSTFPLVITASNGVAPDAAQAFSLVVTKVAAVVLPPTKPAASGKLGGVPPRVRPGQVFTVTGDGFRPGAPIEIGWYAGNGNGRAKGTVVVHATADADGRFSARLTAPGELGAKTVVAAGLAADGTARYLSAGTVVTAQPGVAVGPTPPDRGTGAPANRPPADGTGLAFTGLVTDLRMSVLSGLALVLAGLTVTVLARRRRQVVAGP